MSEYEAMYRGSQRGTIRVNNGTPNYEKFEAGVPKKVDATMAQKLLKMPKDFLVREIQSQTTEEVISVPKKKRVLKKK